VTPAALFRTGTNGVEAWVRPALLARMEGVPSALFCAGVGPLRTRAGRALFAMACEAADLLLVRDEASAREVLGIVPWARPVVATDPAHLLEAGEDDRRHVAEALRHTGVDRPPVSVAVRAWDLGIERARLVRELADGLRTLPVRLPIVFAPFHRGAGTEDGEVAEAVRSALPDRPTAVVDLGTPGQAIALFERSTLVVAARNHGVAFAGCAGTPVLPVAYDPKVVGCAAAVGVDDLVVDIRDLGRLPQALSGALAETSRIRARMAGRRETLRAEIGRAFDSLEALLASPLAGPRGPRDPDAEAGHLGPGFEHVERGLMRLHRGLQALQEQLRRA
jgi:colanic acid/amylovoran biosynthesis protein